MTLALYMDVHVPRALTDALRRRGLDVLASQDDGTTRTDDPDLLARASALGRLLFTQDQDFLRHAAEWQRRGRPFAGLVYAAQQCASLGVLAADLELLLSCSIPDDVRDRVTYLPLR